MVVFKDSNGSSPDKHTHHVLHADTDLSIAVESSVKAHYVGRVAFMQDLQFSNDLVPDCWFDLKMNELNGTKKKNKQKQTLNHEACTNLSLNRTVVSSTKTGQIIENILGKSNKF